MFGTGSDSKGPEEKGLEAGVDQMKSACLRDPNERAVIDVAAQMPLGKESDLIPGGALPA